MPVSNSSLSQSAEEGLGRLEVRLLGPFEVATAGRAIHIGSPKQRAVLALLALQAGRLVTSDALCDLIWEEDQPVSPTATLQSLISRLRGALTGGGGAVAEGGRDVLRTRGPGWVLDVAPAEVDALRFHELQARARQRTGRGDAEAAAADLAEAIALWRGAALVDVVDAGYLAAQATRLNEDRLDAVEDLAEAELAIGRPADALGRLEAHVEANPLRERGWELLMVALYRLGRQAAALGASQQVRAILREELGLEPSPELSEIEQRILRHDPTLAGRPPSSAGASVLASREASSRSAVNVQGTEAGGEFADYSVVVVEDHDFQRRTVVQLLRNLGVGAVAGAASGTEALDILKSDSGPDVIICDIDMPGMDGIEFVTRVAESDLASAIVIASGLEANVVRAVEAIGEGQGLHVLAALEKPLTARRLGEVLRQYTRVHKERANGVGSAPVSGEDLRRALRSAAVIGQFQPRINLTTGTVSSAEATGRWHGPDGSPIPASVLADAVANGSLLLAYTERLVTESCVLLDQAERAGVEVHAPIRVAVNMSRLPLGDTSLAAWLTGIVQSRGEDPHRFVCELDDVALARAPTSALEVLTRLRVKGFGLAIRHSGAGPSWTNQLERVPVSELKLDRRLVTGSTSDPKRFVMLESAVTTARDMGLPVVADGCDSRADFDTLVALGCSEAQGRFVAEPMQPPELVAWVLAGCQPNGSGVST